MTSAANETRLLSLLKGLTNFKDSYTTNTLSFDEATSKIIDTASGLAWLAPGDPITISGSTSNNSTFTVEAVAAGEITVTEPLITEAAGDIVTITAPEHITKGDYRILDTGIKESVVIVPGTFDSDEAASHTVRRNWYELLDLFERYTDDATTWAAFVALRDAVINYLDLYPTLNAIGGVSVVAVSADGDPQECYDKQGRGPFFVYQRLRIHIIERVGLTGGEYA